MWEAIETPRPSAWRVIFKGLTLLEHLLKNGSERCVDDARNHSHILRNLDRFNYYEGTIDRGVGVREKSKQVVEVLQDDERIREERQKARTLREKFSGRGAVSSGSGGGGGGGGVKYEGYGNSDAKWAQSSGAGGGTSYGDSGIGATTSRSADSNKAYAGRYGEGDIATMSTARRSSSKSSTGGAKVKKTKKKEKAVVPEAAVPELDLFSFDAAPTTSAPIADHSFDAFGSSSPAPTATMVSLPPPSLQQQTHPSAAVTTHDDFGDFATASSAVQFDAFGTAPPSAQPTFDAFGSSPPPMATMNNAFGNMSMSSSSSSGPNNMMNTNNSIPANTAVGSNDDFGDFEDADPFANKSSQTSSDPLSKLISLDGLTKKPKKVEGKPDTGAPIDFSKPLGGMGGAATLGDNFEAPLVLGTGKQGDIGEVFGQLMESTPKPGMMVGQQKNNGIGMASSVGGMGGMMTGGDNNMMGGQPMYPQMQMGMGQPQQQSMMFNQGNMGMMGGNMSLQQQQQQQQQQQMMMMQQQMQMQGGMMQPQMGNMMGMHGQQMNMMGGAQSQPQQKNNMNGNGNNMGW
jgi:epsin